MKDSLLYDSAGVANWQIMWTTSPGDQYIKYIVKQGKYAYYLIIMIIV